MKLKTTIALLVGLTLLAASLLARPRMDRPPALYKSATPVTDATIDANRVFSYVTNLGTFARDNVGVLNLAGGGGMVYPFAGLANIANGQANKTCVFASGIWIGGIDSTVGSPNIGDTLMTISEFSEENVPGPMLGGTFQTDNPSFRVYKLYRDSLASNPNADYLAWPVADGAPVDSLGAPELTGDQMLWSVFNDADPAAHGNDAGSTLPMGIEIQMSTFAFTREGALGDIIFLRYKIMNKGNKNLRQVYISLWSDPDLGGFADDLVGSDTALSLGFVYNATSADAVYGSRPPAVGYDFFQGPLVASPGSTGRMWGIPQPGFTNLGLVSFNKYINGTDPDFAAESYMYQNGLDAKAAAPLIDPTTGLVTKFFGSGDPVTGTGFLDSNPADRRFMLNTGPIDFNPGDSTEVIAAIIVGQGNDRKSSITLMKFFDETAQSTFDNFFQPPVPPAAPVVSVANLPNEITLTWGNESELSPGDFDFQGYTVYQGPTVTGPWTRLLTADVIDTIAVVLERELDLASGELVELPKQLGSNSGLQRFAAFTDDAIGGGRLNNVTEYFFRVEAYAVDLTQTPRSLSTSTVVTVTPQTPVAGTTFGQDALDTLTTTHSAGTSDGSVTPLVIDPGLLTGASYQVTFSVDPTLGDVWHVINTTAVPPDTILKNQTNQANDNDYLIEDGLLVKVSGPPLQGKAWSYTSASPLNVSPVATADNGYAGGDRWLTGGSHGGELLFGGIFMEPNFWGATTLAGADYRVVEIRFRPMVSYTDLTGDGMYTVGEPYVIDDPAQTQSAFMYQTFNGGAYQGFNPVPFTAWDVTNPATPVQLNIVVRDRDANGQWDLHSDLTGDPIAGPLLPNGGDQRFNYTWILSTPYDATGTQYGDGTGGTIDFFAAPGGAVWDAMWTMWIDERGTSRGPLAEEAVLTLTPNFVNSAADVFSFSAPAPVVTASVTEADLSNVRPVPNPYYLFSAYEPDLFNREIRFTNLPTECTIRIFNLNGEIIRTLFKNDATTSFLAWDVNTENRLPVASGIYIYLVTTPSGAELMGKMAVFTEAEQLTNF